MPTKETKEFDYKSILDIMDKALKFDRVKLEVRNCFTLELDTSGTVKTTLLKAEAKVKEIEVKEKDQEQEEMEQRKLDAIKEITKHEELLFNDPDEYVEMNTNQKKYFDEKYKGE